MGWVVHGPPNTECITQVGSAGGGDQAKHPNPESLPPAPPVPATLALAFFALFVFEVPLKFGAALSVVSQVMRVVRSHRIRPLL